MTKPFSMFNSSKIMNFKIIYTKFIWIMMLGTTVFAACQTNKPTPLIAVTTATDQPSQAKPLFPWL